MNLPNVPGTTFKFVVGSAEQAAELIRDQLGENARVLSVRSVSPSGLFGFLSAPKLEVVAQITAVAADPVPAVVAVPGEPPVASAATEAGGEGRAWPRAELSGPQRLDDLLRRSGFSERVLLRLHASPLWPSLGELPLHRALVITGRYLLKQTAARTKVEPLTRAAFIGTPGSGRTTALCKWLSREVFRCARIGHVVTAEFDRPNATGPLPVFCEALGVPLAHFPASTRPATPGGFVYFDLPGLLLRHPDDNASLAEFLDREAITQRVLVLNAAYDHALLRAGYAAGCELGATHVVFTHLDEVTQWGRLWDYLLEGRLQPLFLATGPSLSGDLEEDPLEAVANRTLPMETPAGADTDPAEPGDAAAGELTAAA